MCYKEPHFAPRTKETIRSCANKQIAGESRRLSFALWTLVRRCPDERLDGIGELNRRRIENIIREGWRRQSITLSLSTIRLLVEELGGELELVAVPCAGVPALWRQVNLKCQTSNAAEIAMLLNRLHSSLPAKIFSTGRGYIRACNDKYAGIAALTGLQESTAQAAMCFYREPRFRTMMLISAAMRHRVFMRIRLDGRAINRASLPFEHEAYLERMREKSGRIALSS